MDTLETQLGAFGFRLESIPELAAASLWTWLAVVAAAVGLWSIKAVGSKVDGSLSSPRASKEPTTLDVAKTSVQLAQAEPCKPLACTSVLVPSVGLLMGHKEQVSSPKDRLTIYYGSSFVEHFIHKDDDDDNDDECNDKCIAMIVDKSDNDEVKFWRLAKEMELMQRDLGWYRYQDMTMLNGNVVKLWNGRRKLTQSIILRNF